MRPKSTQLFLKKVFFLGASVKIFEACFEAVVSQNNPKKFSTDILREQSW